MSARVGWILVAAVAVIVLVVAALYVFNPAVTLVSRDGRRTWIVRAEGKTVTLPGEVRPDDALVCVLDGADASVSQLIDLYTTADSRIWIEGERIENPPEGGAGTVFDRDTAVFITCGVEIRM